jgi:hypothetical protein
LRFRSPESGRFISEADLAARFPDSYFEQLQVAAESAGLAPTEIIDDKGQIELVEELPPEAIAQLAIEEGAAPESVAEEIAEAEDRIALDAEERELIEEERARYDLDDAAGDFGPETADDEDREPVDLDSEDDDDAHANDADQDADQDDDADQDEGGGGVWDQDGQDYPDTPVRPDDSTAEAGDLDNPYAGWIEVEPPTQEEIDEAEALEAERAEEFDVDDLWDPDYGDHGEYDDYPDYGDIDGVFKSG